MNIIVIMLQIYLGILPVKLGKHTLIKFPLGVKYKRKDYFRVGLTHGDSSYGSKSFLHKQEVEMYLLGLDK